jgi:AraC-like DNA-binding protein
MNEKLVLIITSVAAFSLILTSILSFRKAKENVGYFWLGMLFLSIVIAFVSNLLIFLKSGSVLLYHLSVILNLSWGAYLILMFTNLRNGQKRFFKWWLFLPSVAYLPFMFYSFVDPRYVNKIVSGQYQSISFAISSFYGFTIVAYSILANILVMIREIKERHLSPQHKIRAEIIVVVLALQLLAFVPYILKLDIVYVIMYMPVFGLVFFLYSFFRLSPGKAITFLNPVTKEKYTGLNTCMERKGELESKLLDLMNGKKPFLCEDCTLQLVANELNESPNTISMIVNSHFEKSFPDFINCYRVKWAIDILQSANNSLTIEGVAFECGFGNRTTFYKAFKKETGKLPSDYLKEKDVSGCDS